MSPVARMPPPAHAQRAADYLHGMPPATQEARAPYGGRQGVLCYSSFGERSRTAGRSGRLSFREREAHGSDSSLRNP
jgi:hypothetical protein